MDNDTFTYTPPDPPPLPHRGLLGGPAKVAITVGLMLGAGAGGFAIAQALAAPSSTFAASNASAPGVFGDQAAQAAAAAPTPAPSSHPCPNMGSHSSSSTSTTGFMPY